MSQEKVKNGDLVIPGQVLGVIEEYIPDKHTTYEKDGNVLASMAGYLEINPSTRNVCVKGTEMTNTLKRGEQVIGFIRHIRKFSIGVEIYKRDDKILYNPIEANIHVSRISKQYIAKPEDAFSETDIVRARVVGKRNNEFELATDSNYLGVIYAECNICGFPLRRKEHVLICDHCGNHEKKLLANDYGRVKEKVIL
ncbi:MAG: exosome complex RNA-binding protein Csl4 [Promethearchaeota archaeon CR_4]|nr:MAG: exosome complex RNA-binding protein Csl4 [Candidatus Lokiarchaeota archaeon CR_4]